MPASTSPQLRIYSSQDFMPSGIPDVPMLFPFWGLPKSEPTPSVYSALMRNAADHFRIVSAEEADFFVLPLDWRYTTRAVARTEEDADDARTAAQRFANSGG